MGTGGPNDKNDAFTAVGHKTVRTIKIQKCSWVSHSNII